MSHEDHRVLYRGAVEDVEATVTSPVILDTQPVAISFDNLTWINATWTGDPDTTRGVTAVVDVDDTFTTTGYYPLLVRVTNGSKIPIFPAGVVEVR